VATAEKAVQAKIQRLKIDDWLQVEVQGRTLVLRVDSGARQEAAQLDACYVIKTDLPVSAASKQQVHDRYKHLRQVEQAFRTCKTTHLETRPIQVRTEAHTRAHVLVVMLAYLIRRVLSRAWAGLDVTVEEGLQQLKALSSTEMKSNDAGSCLGPSRALACARKGTPGPLPISRLPSASTTGRVKEDFGAWHGAF